MGKFLCGSKIEVEFDDRVLAHLQLVIGAKLRRGESLYFTWRDSSDSGDGRTCVWLHPNLDMAFKFYGARPPHVNREWIDALMLEANKPTGLKLIDEPNSTDETPLGHHNSVNSGV